MNPENDNNTPVLQPLTEEELEARKRRNLWLALSLVGFVTLVLVITFIRLSQSSVMPDGGF